MMEEPLAFRPTRWGQGLRADDSVPMGGRLAVGLVLSTGFGRGRRGAWVRRALREDDQRLFQAAITKEASQLREASRR